MQSTDIVETVQRHVPLTRHGKEFVGLCPFHPDHRPSMRVSPKKQIFKCFACGAGGDAIKFVQLRERLSFRDALAALAQRAGIELETTPEQRQANQARDHARGALTWAAEFYQRALHETPAGKKALEYAHSRGLSDETIRRHQLGYAPEAWDELTRAAQRAGVSTEVLLHAGLVIQKDRGGVYDRFRHRLIFPIFDVLGRAVGFGGRALGDDPAKYLNSPETPLFSKSRVLYGLNLAKDAIEQQGESLVVEGYMDAVMLHQYGFRHTVAVLGTALTDVHVRMLKQRSERIVLCFDGDDAGQRAADRAVEASLLGGADVRVVVLPTGVDPADLVVERGSDAFAAVLKDSTDALEFKWTLVQRGQTTQGPRSRREAIEHLINFLAEVLARGGNDPLERGLLVRRLAEMLALPADAVLPMLVAAGRRVQTADNTRADAVPTSSPYDESVANLPRGVVATAEDLLGALVAEPACLELINDAVVETFERNDCWKRLYAIVQNLWDEHGAYSRDDVLERADDADLCELLGRVWQREGASLTPRELFQAATQRLLADHDVREMGRYQDELHRASEDVERAAAQFDLLRDTARGRDSALAARTQWSAPAHQD